MVRTQTRAHRFAGHRFCPNNNLNPPFTGNFNLVYAIIRKRNVFHQLANLPSDTASIQRALQKKKRTGISRTNSVENESMEGSRPAVPAEPGTLKASLEATPGRKEEVEFQITRIFT